MIETLSDWIDISNHLNDEQNWTRKYVQLDVKEHRLRISSNECIRSQNDEQVFKSDVIFPSISDYLTPSISKTVLSSSIINDQKSVKDYPQLHSSIDSLSDRPSSITTITTTATTTARQSKTKFSHFFSRSTTNQKSNQIDNTLLPSNSTINSLKRTKSVTKLERPKPSFFSTHFANIPSNRSRSHESLIYGNDSLKSIYPAKPIDLFLDNCQIRRIHPSIIDKSDLNSNEIYQCVQIENSPFNEKYYLRSKECFQDNNLILNHLQKISAEKSIDNLRFDNSLDICILEAKGLPIKKKYYMKIFLDDVVYGKTTSKERRDILFWGEYFLFKDLPQDCSTLSCKIYRENERRKSKQNDIDLIGIIDIPLSTITGNQFIEQWYSLQQFNTKDKSNKFSDGSINIRIKAKYQPIQILPIHAYQSLQDYLHQNYLPLIAILEPHINLREKDEIATSLTRIGQSLNYCTEYLVDIIQSEVLSTSDNTLTFRGNSIATKSMEAYMKLIGENYLRETLSRFINEIVLSKTSNDIDFEVDPDRLTNIQYLQRNQINLRLLAENIWMDIQQSYFIFPQELKIIFWKLRQLSSSDETMFHLISGSVFLRFLCPAILTPNLFGLTQEYPNEKTSRKLTLIAKTLQTLANFSRFGSKESYMKFMNDFVSKESDNMRRFLANISTIDDEYNEREIRSSELKYDIDLGREYSIIHQTLFHLFEELDFSIRQSLNDLEDILIELTNLNKSYLTSNSSGEIHIHHHHHHIYHHLSKSSSNSELSLNGTGITTNGSSQGYHSISTSSTLTNIDQIRPPLSFINPLYQQDTNDHHSTKQLTFFNNLSQQLNDDEQTKINSSQQNPPKMGLKALNHLKDYGNNQRSTIFNLYHQEKSRRIESEKETERLRFELEQLNEQLKEYRYLIHRKSSSENLLHCYDDDSKPIEIDHLSDTSHVEDQIE